MFEENKAEFNSQENEMGDGLSSSYTFGDPPSFGNNIMQVEMIGEDHDDIPSDRSRVRDLNDQSGEESYLGISGNSRSEPSIIPKSKVIG
jgi:hypothetical protein